MVAISQEKENYCKNFTGKQNVADKIEPIVKRAFKLAEEHKHQYVTLEHLLHSLLRDRTIGSFLKEIKVDSKDILKELSISELKIKDFYRLKIGE